MPSLLSPPISSSSTATPPLPHPRSHPLKPGSTKENAFVNYVDNKLTEISGRYERRFNTGLESEDSTTEPSGLANSGNQPATGYQTFAEAAKDLENILDIVWVSGTRM